jgi:hypothetical protein
VHGSLYTEVRQEDRDIMKLLKQVARNVRVALVISSAGVCLAQNGPAPAGDRGTAYYNYTLAHMYANLAAETPNRTDYVQEALRLTRQPSRLTRNRW